MVLKIETRASHLATSSALSSFFISRQSLAKSLRLGWNFQFSSLPGTHPRSQLTGSFLETLIIIFLQKISLSLVPWGTRLVCHTVPLRCLGLDTVSRRPGLPRAARTEGRRIYAKRASPQGRARPARTRGPAPGLGHRMGAMCRGTATHAGHAPRYLPVPTRRPPRALPTRVHLQTWSGRTPHRHLP